ncbi:MAG TPA: cupin domain-containing protein [Parafilimonas sp.]|nr:cupin domain-containing protein [Parafilimonas sp.]
MSAQNIIDKLKLTRHPEGGFYRETYRSDHVIVNDRNEDRNLSTAIYYLLKDEDRSLFHRIRSDELWFFHAGEPLEIVLIEREQLTTITLGNNIEQQFPQVRIPANTWFAARVKNAKGFSLVSCVVSPGFDFADFELAKRADLIGQFPHLKNAIEELTQ